MIGSILGNYKVVSQISAGGMGSVYRAEHTLIGRVVAIKVLHPEMCANKEIVNRFFNEAKATTAINHPGIVEIFDFGYMPSGHAYLVMEFLDGMSLGQRIKLRKPIPEGEAAMIVRGVCSALSAAHAKGIVHRDLKPDNIFVIPDPDSALGERCKLLDFGIAKLTDIGMAASTTKTGAVMGTPTYMSPEQCRGTGDVDHRADLYSLGCILYELICGVPPFRLKGAGELIGAHLYATPEAPSKKMASISAETETLVMTLLEKSPERRIQSARELGAYLGQIATHQGWSVGADAERASMQTMSTPMPTPAPPSFTPLFPSTREPISIAPLMPTPAQTADQPTTLSSSVGQTRPTAAEPAPRSRARMWIGLVAATLAIIGGIAIVGTMKHASTAAVVQPASQPTAMPVTVTPPPAAAVAPTPVAPPPVAPPPVVVEPPPEPPIAATVKKPIAKKPTVKKPVTPAKPTDPQPKKKDDPLLENDL